jgi:hypothetical protein
VAGKAAGGNGWKSHTRSRREEELDRRRGSVATRGHRSKSKIESAPRALDRK